MARPVFSFRCSAEMQAEIDEAAAANGLTRSEWLAEAATEFLDRGQSCGGEHAAGLRQVARKIDARADAEARIDRRAKAAGLTRAQWLAEAIREKEHRDDAEDEEIRAEVGELGADAFRAARRLGR